MKLFASLALFFVVLTHCLAQSPPHWNASTSYQPDDIVVCSDHNYYRCIVAHHGANPVADPHRYWELNWVRTSTVLSAGPGERFPDFHTVWGFIGNATVAGGCTITIQENPTATIAEHFPSAISLNHPFGSQININTNSNITWKFDNPGTALYLTKGHTFGSITGLQITGPLKYDVTSTGVVATQRSCFSSLNVTLTGFTTGVEATEDSFINCSGTTINVFSDIGLLATSGSQIVATEANITGILHAGLNKPLGVSATNSSYINCNYARIKSCTIGVSALNGARISMKYSKLSDGGEGIDGELDSYIDAEYASITNHQYTAVFVGSGSKVFAHGISLSGDGINFNISPNNMSGDGSEIFR